MKLMHFDPVTKLPEPTAECLLIPEFLEIWTRQYKIDGDRLGAKKTRNLQEFGYIYFHGVYDSRYKHITDPIERDKKIKSIVKLPEDWKPDVTVKTAIEIFRDSQVTSSSMLVDSIEGANVDLSKWIITKRLALQGGNTSPKDVSEILSIISEIPKMIRDTKEARTILDKEQEKQVTGRNGRKPNLFEVPEVSEGGL